MARLGVCLVMAGAVPGAAFAFDCDEPSRTITVKPGQNVGAYPPGRLALPLADREVVLTFDDGPNPATTPVILDALRKACAPATFFVLGEPAADHPEIVQRELAEGHTVGSHTATHANLAEETFSEAIKDIEDGIVPVKAAGGSISLFRFPHLQDTPDLLGWLNARGVSVIGADIDPMDWAGDPPGETLARIKAQLDERRGGIILLHDSQPNTARLLPGLLALLSREGYAVVRLDGAPVHRQLAAEKPR